MRTTVDIPDRLLEEAQQLARLSTKREAIMAGLQELIRKVRREELRQLAGGLSLDIDLVSSRKKKR